MSAQQTVLIALGGDVAPVFLRGLEEEQIHLAARGDGGEDIEVKRRERGQAEEMNALGQPRKPRAAQGKLFAEVSPQRSGMMFAKAAGNFPPQRGLPDFLRLDATIVPIEHHLGTIDEVLLEELRKAVGELDEFARIGLLAKVMPDRIEASPIEQRGQRLDDSPDERVAAGGGFQRRVRRHVAEEFVTDFLREKELEVRADAEAPGQFQAQPSLHAAMAHDDELRQERRR